MKNNLTSTSTVTSRHQTVIQAVQEPMIMVSSPSQDWSAYLSGLGKHVWKDIRIDDYLKQLWSE